MTVKKIFLLSLLFTLPWQLKAQEDNTWTLQECINYALEQNLTLRRGELDLQSSELNYKQSKYDLMPSLNASGGYGFNWGRTINPTTNVFISSRLEFARANATANATLFQGLQLMNTIKQNEHRLHASKFDVEDIKNDVTLNIISLYTSVIFNEELLETSEAQLANTEQELLRVTKQVEAGALPLSDQLEFEAQQASNELDVIQQQNALDLSLLQLKQALQLPADQPFNVVVPEQLDEEILAQPVPNYTSAEIFDRAVENLPEIKAAKERIEAANMGVQVAKGGFYPSITANGNLNTQYSDASNTFIPDPPFSQQVENNFGQSLSLGISIPIFNKFSTRTNLQQAQITEQVAELNYQESKNNLRQDIEVAYNDVLAAAKSYMAATKQVEAREEAFRMTNRRYDAGATTIVDYQLAENRLFQSRSDLLRAKYDYIFKMEILDFYLGNPLDFNNNN